MNCYRKVVVEITGIVQDEIQALDNNKGRAGSLKSVYGWQYQVLMCCCWKSSRESHMALQVLFLLGRRRVLARRAFQSFENASSNRDGIFRKS